LFLRHPSAHISVHYWGVFLPSIFLEVLDHPARPQSCFAESSGHHRFHVEVADPEPIFLQKS
jgi:hypothetical protein